MIKLFKPTKLIQNRHIRCNDSYFFDFHHDDGLIAQEGAFGYRSPTIFQASSDFDLIVCAVH